MTLATQRGALIEYTLADLPRVLVFDYNPSTLRYDHRFTNPSAKTPGVRGGSFDSAEDTMRATQGARVEPQAFSIAILLDASDRIAHGDPLAARYGVEPELDTLRAMHEPRSQAPAGAQVLSLLGHGGKRSHQSAESLPVLLFVWGSHVLPVLLRWVDIEELAHLPSLTPLRAKATLDFEILEGDNPFYRVESLRRLASAAIAPRNAISLTNPLGGFF